MNEDQYRYNSMRNKSFPTKACNRFIWPTASLPIVVYQRLRQAKTILQISLRREDRDPQKYENTGERIHVLC